MTVIGISDALIVLNQLARSAMINSCVVCGVICYLNRHTITCRIKSKYFGDVAMVLIVGQLVLSEATLGVILVLMV